MSGSNAHGKASTSRASGSGSSGSISSSFLGLKAELERSKASSPSGSSKRKSSNDLDRRRSKTLSSAFLDSTSTTKKSKRNHDRLNDTERKQKNRSSASAATEHDEEPSAKHLDRIRANLERKARIYDQLQAGKFAGFTSAELKEGSIDWDRKRLIEPKARSPSPATSPSGTGRDDEPQIEYVDEFGRTRTSRLSDVPRRFLPKQLGGDLLQEEEEVHHEDNAIYGPATTFPVYDPEVHRKAKRDREEEAARSSSKQHFDPEFDQRHRGAAFYKFSQREEERQRQLDQLAELRRETLVKRREMDAESGQDARGRVG